VREELLDKDVFKQSVLYDEQKGGIDIYAGKLINLHPTEIIYISIMYPRLFCLVIIIIFIA
ncbi:hypothetical protein DW063_09605, partial [Ruminococcus sp. AF43-11]